MTDQRPPHAEDPDGPTLDDRADLAYNALLLHQERKAAAGLGALTRTDVLDTLDDWSTVSCGRDEKPCRSDDDECCDERMLGVLLWGEIDAALAGQAT